MKTKIFVFKVRGRYLMKFIGIFTIKVIIFNLVFFTFIYAYIPKNSIFLLKDLVSQARMIVNDNSVQKQLIGSLTSCFAIKDKINRSNIVNNHELLEYGKKHLKDLCE